MKEKNYFEKIFESIDRKEKLKEDGLSIVKENKIDKWNQEIEDSPFNYYFGEDVNCALIIMKAIERGMSAKEALHISEHRYEIPANRTIELVSTYYPYGDEFYSECSDIQKKAFAKKAFAKKLSLFNKLEKKDK